MEYRDRRPIIRPPVDAPAPPVGLRYPSWMDSAFMSMSSVMVSSVPTLAVPGPTVVAGIDAQRYGLIFVRSTGGSGSLVLAPTSDAQTYPWFTLLTGERRALSLFVDLYPVTSAWYAFGNITGTLRVFEVRHNGSPLPELAVRGGDTPAAVRGAYRVPPESSGGREYPADQR